MVSVDMVDFTNSETDIQDGEGFAYAPKIYTNPNYAITVPLTESEDNELELVPKNLQESIVVSVQKGTVDAGVPSLIGMKS